MTLRYTVIFLLAILLMGCAHIPRPTFFQNRDKEYLAARSIPPLRIPPGFSSSAFHNYYPISDRQYSGSPKDVSIVPPGLYP